MPFVMFDQNVMKFMDEFYESGIAVKNYKEIMETAGIEDSLQEAYADVLSQSNDIEEFRCNVYLEGLAEGDYTTDFVCTKTDGTIIVRECIYRSRLIKPMHYKLLEASRSY